MSRRCSRQRKPFKRFPLQGQISSHRAEATVLLRKNVKFKLHSRPTARDPQFALRKLVKVPSKMLPLLAKTVNSPGFPVKYEKQPANNLNTGPGRCLRSSSRGRARFLVLLFPILPAPFSVICRRTEKIESQTPLAQANATNKRQPANADTIHRRAIAIDMHADTTQRLVDENVDLTERLPDGHFDSVRARKAGSTRNSSQFGLSRNCLAAAVRQR